MENLSRALTEEMGREVKRKSVWKCFYGAYSYLLYQDTAGLLQLLDYRSSLGQEERKHERYFIFRYMLQLIKNRHPKAYNHLCPVPN